MSAWLQLKCVGTAYIFNILIRQCLEVNCECEDRVKEKTLHATQLTVTNSNYDYYIRDASMSIISFLKPSCTVLEGFEAHVFGMMLKEDN